MPTDRSSPGRRYVGLLAAILAVAVVVGLSKGSAMSRRHPDAATSAVPVPRVEVSLRIERGGTMTPATVSVEKGTRVAVNLVNESGRPVRVELPGYDDQLQPTKLDAGANWRGEFLAGRPGDGFAWMVDGKPSGRLIVKGSHMVEGHR